MRGWPCWSVAYSQPELFQHGAELLAQQYGQHPLVNGQHRFQKCCRLLGRTWKQLQRWVYAAAVLTAAHWLFLKYEFGPVLFHFAPLALLEGVSVWKRRGPQKARQEGERHVH